MKYYLAGPMTGLPEYNFPMFEKVAEYLRNGGLEIVSPHEIDHGETLETRGRGLYATYIRAGLKLLLDCDGIIMLPGWKDSGGARLELYVAHVCCLEMHRFDPDTGDVLDLKEWEVAL